MRQAVRRLTYELQPDTKAFNSRLFSNLLIIEEVRAKTDIEETLLAIRVRLKDETMTKSTFERLLQRVLREST